MVKILFIGDISLNDNYIDAYKNGLNPFESLEPVLRFSDFVIGNLECMVKGEQGENELKKPRLTTTFETLNYLKNIHLNVACLAQNHVYDHLEDGFLKTTSFLKSNGILHLGAGFTNDEATKPLILKYREIKIAILNYVSHDTNTNLPESAGIFLNIFDVKKVKKDIRYLRSNVNHIVLLLHWGGRVEGGLYPDWDQPKIAHELIDTGADLIIGHHSHTIQPFEVYKGKYVFYSLGNFCFSDYWFNGKLNPMPKRRLITAIISITFNKTEYSIHHDFFRNEKVSFVKLDSYKGKVRRRNMVFKILLSNRPFWYIYYFSLRFILPFFLFSIRKDLSTRQKLHSFFKSVRRKLC
jgi:poly-gamma-glutamate capsule biosynthesis protein CapA/YwtB (metallophosphatase superfamily)